MTPEQRAAEMDAIIAAARSRGADLRSIAPLERNGWRVVCAWGSLTTRTMVILEGEELATLLELMPRVDDFVSEVELRDDARRAVEP
jgi:hypothetical protein